MYGSNRVEDRLRSDIYRLVTDSLLSPPTPEVSRHLQELLETSPLARQIYYECLNDTMILRDVSGRFAEQASSEFAEMRAEAYPDISAEVNLGKCSVAETDGFHQSSESQAPAILHGDVPATNERRPSSYSMRRAAVALAGAIAAVILVGFIVFPRNPPGRAGDRLAEQVIEPNESASLASSPEVDSSRDADTEANQFIARVLNVSSDAGWSDGGAPRDFLLRLRANEHLAITSGFVEIEFHSSATVVLHGPAIFVPLGPQSARLEQGKLTGQAESGGFQLETGAAEVIDIGTEFGVAVDDVAGTDVYVFDGEVEVTPMLAHTQPPKSHLLTEGFGVRVRMNGDVDYEATINVDGFTRSVPCANAMNKQLDRLSLVDIVSGGDGLGNRLAGVINPLTGDWDHRNQLYENGKHKGLQPSDGLYHSCSCNDLVDGVFVPEASPGEVQIDSSQRSFALGGTEGVTYGPIWVRRKTPSDDSLFAVDGFSANFWGTGTLGPILSRLANSRTGLMGIHPNVGITFDLSKIRKNQEQALSRFQATVVNLDNAEEWIQHQATVIRRNNVEQWVQTEIAKYPERTADVRILVDGELRYSRLDFSCQDGEVLIDVEIAEQDRFLTILSTDAGNATSFDHVVLVDPEFVLTEVQD